jgi:hypothetical protein
MGWPVDPHSGFKAEPVKPLRDFCRLIEGQAGNLSIRAESNLAGTAFGVDPGASAGYDF